MMLENLILKREWFQTTLNENGIEYPRSPYEIIPFLHPSIIINGIDIELFDDELIRVIEHNASLDKKKRVRLGKKKIETKKARCNNTLFEYKALSFPDYMPGLYIEPSQVTPRGGDGGIYLEGEIAEKYGKQCNITRQKGIYRLPQGVMLNDDLLREYRIEQHKGENHYILKVQTGWHPHNTLDPILIKSVVISLNNIVVKRLYSNNK